MKTTYNGKFKCIVCQETYTDKKEMMNCYGSCLEENGRRLDKEEMEIQTKRGTGFTPITKF